MARMIPWRRRDDHTGVVWTSKTKKWQKMDLSFTIEAAYSGGYAPRNAKLIVRKAEPGKKIAKTVILTKEFRTGYQCKDYIDSLLYVSMIMFENELEDSNRPELWFLEQLNNTKDYPTPTPTLVKEWSTHRHTYASGMGWPR